MSGAFADHFSAQSEDYARFRPSYPQALFAWLAEIAPRRWLAWDCATGSGQAALGLAEHFDRVLASDASAAQLAGAARHPRVHYLRARAESSGLAGARFDLISVAQALHWFDLDAFYREVRQLLRPRGVLAVWSYQLLRCEPGIDCLIDRFDRDVVGPYWPPERRLVDSGYRELVFPLEEITVPTLDMHADWDLGELVGYLGTWSSVHRYRKTLGRDPLEPLVPALAKEWGDAGARRRIRWPLTLRAGRNI